MGTKCGTLQQYITTSRGFQYSVNIKYDLNDEEKIINYIPLSQHVRVIKDLLLSLRPESTQRARIISGSYGTGKSHLGVTLLSLLSKVFPPETYVELIKKIRNVCPETAEMVDWQIRRGKKFLPVILTGGEQTVVQSLLNGLERSLKEHGLEHLMPRTSMKAALEQIEIWRGNYPTAYRELEEYLERGGKNVEQLRYELEHQDEESYSLFLQAYTQITHGAHFNPMLMSEPADVYRYVAGNLPPPYGGIIVVFDEFGRYLENQWSAGRRVNLQPLQDFAEACNTSGSLNLHLILITHKQISQYAAKHSHELFNEWKKVEGRFKGIEIITQPAKVYELMSQVIIKEQDYWEDFCRRHEEAFRALAQKICKTRLFAELSLEAFEEYILNGVFPLHPVTAFCLPRLSQLVAQNERTVFTFLAARDYHALSSFLAATSSDQFKLLTVDWLFDYFESQLKGSDSDERVRHVWVQATGAINRLSGDMVLETKLIKALAVIKIINLPSVLPATAEMLYLAFEGSGYSLEEVTKALRRLLNSKIVFEGLSSGIMEFIEPAEIDISAELSLLIPKRQHLFEPISYLNHYFRPQPVLAKGYNDAYAMTRYFTCLYIQDQDPVRYARECLERELMRDGFIFYLCPVHHRPLKELVGVLKQAGVDRAVFVVPLHYSDDEIEELFTLLRRLDALRVMERELEGRAHVEADRQELLLWLAETEKSIKTLLSRLYAPSNTVVVFQGKTERLATRLDLSKIVSGICATVYTKTPVMNNEMINKHQLTKPIATARKKLVDGLLRPYLKPNLGLSGNGPEIAIFRSLLRAPGREIVWQDQEQAFIRPLHELADPGLKQALETIQRLIDESGDQGVRVDRLIRELCSPPFGIRQGVIPILLALLMHGKTNEYQLVDSQGAERVISGETLEAAMEQPDQFYLQREDWSAEKATFCKELLRLFGGTGEEDEFEPLPRRVVSAVRRWFVSLPKLTRDTQQISKEATGLRKLIRNLQLSSTKLLFQEIPRILGYQELPTAGVEELIYRLRTIKEEMDYYHLWVINRTEKALMNRLPEQRQDSLLSGLKLWYDHLLPEQKTRLYSDGTQELLNLIESFSGEDRVEFAKQVLYVLTGLRVEDWSDATANGIEETFVQMLAEVAEVKETLEGATGGGINHVYIEFEQTDGTKVQRSFPQGGISPSGQLLYNVLRSYLQEYGDAITNNERRNILIRLLEELV